jgi:hypothetical protein
MTRPDPNEDIYSGKRIQWRWVLVGALVVLGSGSLLASSAAALGYELTGASVFFVITTVAFVLGGGIIGWLSPGYTPWEAGLASLLAAGWTAFLVARLVHFEGAFVWTIPVGLLWGTLCGLGGGRLGELVQGDR